MTEELVGAVSRRGVFAGAAGLAAAGLLVSAGCDSDSGGPSPRAVPFHGEHQAGVATAAQDRLVFAAFDVTGDRDQLGPMIRKWSSAAEQMTAGHVIGRAPDDLAPPVDTGEAVGLPASRLTLTFGMGPSLFDGRFGLAGLRPAALEEIPALPGDALDANRSGGDLCIQACADDPQVAFHAVRNLARIARGTAHVRWMQLGFGRTSTTTKGQSTPRNLMGFKDGTNNIRAEDTDAFDRYVWVGSETDQAWMRGGTYLVARRIRMLIETWDRSSLQEQEQTIGRYKASGAPMGQKHEKDDVDLSARGSDGKPVVPLDSHIRLASPTVHGGMRILRRGYSYTDGADPVTGELDAGLFFVAFQKDPRSQFVAIQRELGAHDAMNEYIKHTGSAVFACPPGVSRGQFWGQGLFG